MVKDWFWIALLVILDQLTKLIAIRTDPHTALFDLVWNTGAGFGILQGANWMLLVLGVVVLVVLWRPLMETKGREHIAYIALFAGVIGNSIDRVVHGKVVDFISISSWPVFNIADSLITLSVLYLLARGLKQSFGSWRLYRNKKVRD